MFFGYFSDYYVHQAFGPTYIVTNVVCAVAIALIFNKVELSWRCALRLFIDSLCVWLISLIYNSIFYVIQAQVSDPFYLGLLCRFTVWFFTALLHTIYPNNISKYWLRITLALLVSSFILVGINISGSVGSLITDAYGYPNNFFSDFTAYIVLILIIGIVMLFKSLDLSQFRYIKTTPIVLLNVFFFVGYSMIFAYDWLNPQNNVYKPILYAGVLVADALTYVIFYINAKNYNEVIKSQAYALKLESEKQQLEISNSKYEELHKIRHDIKDQFALLNELMREKKYDEMQHYFADINEKVHVQMDFVDCGNDLLSAICNMELTKAKEQGLEIQYKISVPKELSIEASDLTSVLSNLIDNAIEAEIRDETPSKDIEVEIKQEANYLFIYVENAFTPANHETDVLALHTSKANRSNHGYGTKIVKALAEKNHGYVTYSVQNTTFKASVMLENPCKSPEK